MGKARILCAALLVLAGGAAVADEGNSGTDRSNKPQSLPLICRGGEQAVAVPQADGRLLWICTSTQAQTPPRA